MSKKNRNKEKSVVQKASEKIFGKWTKWWDNQPEYTDYERDDGYRSTPVGPGTTGTGFAKPTYIENVREREHKKTWDKAESGSWSYSSQWQSKVGYNYGGWSSWNSDNKERAKLHEWSAQLARTANITLNSQDSDRPLYLQWASKDTPTYNSPNSSVITISPDALLKASTSEEGMVLDGMIGQVLMASTLKSTMPQDSWESGISNTNGRNIWMALELVAARKELMVNWQGFLPYLIRHSDMTSPDKKLLELDMEAYPSGLQAITNVLAWNITHPENPIEPRSEWLDAIEDAEELLEVVHKDERLMTARSITETMAKTFKGPDTERGRVDGVGDSSLFGGVVPSEQEGRNLSGRIDIRKFNGQYVQFPDGVADLLGPTVVEVHKGLNHYLYKAIADRYASAIKSIVNALRFRSNDQTYYSYGHKSGDLDSGALHKLTLSEEDPAIWERKDVIGLPKLAIGLLMDESGSMREGTKQEDTTTVAIIMTEAFRQLRGIDIMVLGHSANTHTRGSTHERTVSAAPCISPTAKQLRIAEYFTKGHANPYAIPYVESSGNNLDGFAMEHAARKMAKDYPEAAVRLLFVISDGQPAGVTSCQYGGSAAFKHMKMVSEFAKSRLKVDVYGIGVCDAYDEGEGNEMYGNGRFVVIGDVMGSIPILTSFIAQIARKA